MKMKKLFQKINNNNDKSDETPKRKKNPKSKNKKRQPQTPPITPSPPSSPLPIKIISKIDERHTKQLSLSAFTSSSEYYYDNENGNYNDNDKELLQQALFNSSSPPPSSLSDEEKKKNIISSMLGCGTSNDQTDGAGDFGRNEDSQYEEIRTVTSMMWETKKTGLSTILEEELTLWGVPPSESSSDEDEDEDDGDGDENDGGVDAFECILQENNDGRANDDMNKSRNDGDNDNMITKHDQDIDIMFLCKPCMDTNGDTMEKFPSTRENEVRQASTKDDNEVQQQQQTPPRDSKKHSVMKKMSSFTNRMNQKKKDDTNTNAKKEGPKKTLSKIFKSRGQKSPVKTKKKKKKRQKVGKWKCAKDEKSGRIYYYHTLTREVSWDQPSGFQEWKVTLDKNTNKFYYHNVISKQTTWDQPKDFEVWRKVEKEGKRTYYYNVFTKEVAWKKPVDDDDKGDKKQDGIVCNLGNVRTLRAPVNESVTLKGHVGESGKDPAQPSENTVEKSPMLDSLNSKSNGFDRETKEDIEEKDQWAVKRSLKVTAFNPQYNKISDLLRKNEPEEEIDTAATNGERIDESPNDFMLEEKSAVSVSKHSLPENTEEVNHQYESRTLTTETEALVIAASTEDDASDAHQSETLIEPSDSSESNQPGEIQPTSANELLRRLLYEYCPAEKDDNDLLLLKACGKESFIIKGLESLVSETLFDELSLAVSTYVKETLIGIDEKPFDEVHELENNAMIVKEDQSRTDVQSQQGSESLIFSASENSCLMNDKMLSTITGVTNATQAMHNISDAKMNPTKPYTITQGISGISSATQLVNNTSKVRGAIMRSIPDQREFLIANGMMEKDPSVSSIDDLTETEEEDLVSKEKIIDDLKLMEEAEKMLSSIERKEKTSHNEEFQNMEISVKSIKSKNEVKQNPVIENVTVKRINCENEYINDRNEKYEENSLGNSLENSLEELHDSLLDDTFESAYAADDDDLTDDNYSFDDQALDDISALSDSVGRLSRRKRSKEKHRTLEIKAKVSFDFDTAKFSILSVALTFVHTMELNFFLFILMCHSGSD